MDNKCARIYANEQGAEYDPETNTILYGINKNMRALGVNDGTCSNLINPSMYTKQQRCGLGVAGGPYIEHFSTSNNNSYEYIYLLIIVFLLVILIKC
jgi:hypothetical protein